MMPAVRWSPAPGNAVKEGNALSATFIRKVPEARRQRARRNEPRIQQFRIDAGDDIFRANGLAIVEDDARGAPALDDHFAHARFSFDFGTVPARRTRHRLRDRAHAADRMAPYALLAVHLAERMVQPHIGGAGGVGDGVIAD